MDDEFNSFPAALNSCHISQHVFSHNNVLIICKLKKYKYSLLKLRSLHTCVVPLLCVWNHLTRSGPVLCSHPTPGIIPEASPVVYSQMSMVEPVRAAISSTKRHNIAAPLY